MSNHDFKIVKISLLQHAGGYAFIQYAEPRYTKDLDLWISTDSANATAVFDDLAVPFVSRYDLITAKRASGHPQDLIDADLLSQADNLGTGDH